MKLKRILVFLLSVAVVVFVVFSARSAMKMYITIGNEIIQNKFVTSCEGVIRLIQTANADGTMLAVVYDATGRRKR